MNVASWRSLSPRPKRRRSPQGPQILSRGSQIAQASLRVTLRRLYNWRVGRLKAPGATPRCVPWSLLGGERNAGASPPSPYASLFVIRGARRLPAQLPARGRHARPSLHSPPIRWQPRSRSVPPLGRAPERRTRDSKWLQTTCVRRPRAFVPGGSCAWDRSGASNRRLAAHRSRRSAPRVGRRRRTSPSPAGSGRTTQSASSLRWEPTR